MGRIKFNFKITPHAGSGYVGKYKNYGFVISITRNGYHVVWNVNGKYPLIKHEGNPFKTLEEAGNACEKLLEEKLKKAN